MKNIIFSLKKKFLYDTTQKNQKIFFKLNGFDFKLIGLLFLNMIINAAISIIAPFYPGEAARRGISENIVGFVFAALPFGGFFFSLIFGKYMRFWGRKKLLLMGMMLLIIGFIMFAVIDFTMNQGVFLALSLIGRAIQGLGLSAYTSVSYAYLPLLYSMEELPQKIGYMEATTGIGMLIAPIFGSLLYSALGYQSPFYFMAGIIFIFSPWLIRSLPPDDIVSKTDKKLLSLKKLLSKRKIFLTYGLSAITMGGISFLEPVFANYLQTFDLSVIEIGLVFSLGTLSYTLFLIFLGGFTKKIKRNLLMAAGGIFFVISFILIAPQEIIGLPKKIGVVCAGMVVLGYGATLTVLPVIPEFMSLCEEVYPDQKIAVGDMSSGMFDSSILVGSLFGPIISGYLTNGLGFENACSIFALGTFCYIIIYCLFGGMLEELLKNRNNIDKNKKSSKSLLKADELSNSLQNEEDIKV